MQIVLATPGLRAAATLATVFAVAAPALAHAQSAPVRSAPSQYVEVLPTGAGTPAGSPSRPAASAGEAVSDPGSGLDAAAGAATSGDGHLTVLAATMLLTTALVVAWAVTSRRRR